MNIYDEALKSLDRISMVYSKTSKEKELELIK